MAGAGVVGHQIRVDVSDETQAEGMVSGAVEAIGGLELFVNCAARFSAQSVTRITTAEWQRTLDTNLTACVWASRAVGRVT